MRTKRLWIIGSILVVLALLVGIFGCAQGTTTTSSTTSTTTTRTTTTQTTTTSDYQYHRPQLERHKH